MLTAVAIVHIIVTIALIMIVLLQTGRGSEIGAAFGSGSSQTLFGSSGSTSFMTKLTTASVVIFMVTSLLLAYFYSHREYSVKAPSAKAQQQQVPAPAAPAVPVAPAAPAKEAK
jgi:preprotein translocase subunit SecG